MIKNIPNKYDLDLILSEINEKFRGKWDFFYLPLDFENNCNLGFAFINFIEPFHILLFWEIFEAKRWKKFKSNKECSLSYAKFQGKYELTQHLEKSCVMNQKEPEKKPVILTINEPYPKIELPKVNLLFRNMKIIFKKIIKPPLIDSILLIFRDSDKYKSINFFMYIIFDDFFIDSVN